MYLIGIRNLIIKVDARYIKGMLQNPNIQPSTSMNRWIMAILMFHFELVHVKGTFHGPDGLSRRPPQPGNPPVDDSDNSVYEDWIDCLHGFVHQVQLLLPLLRQVSMASHRLRPLVEYNYLHPLASFTSGTDTLPRVATSDNILPLRDDSTTTYSDVPHSAKAITSDARILLVEKWLHNLIRPEGLSDKDYAAFIRYASMFFVMGGKLWQRKRDGAHKLFIPTASRLQVLKAMHDDLGHRGLFATRSALLEQFWWPQVSADIVWYLWTCHPCQIHQMTKVLIPPTCRYASALVQQDIR
ncbi:hypothetical protein J132_02098 [Termitomyces sp. J132]|nr:hypothetical protein J132_02098 [Termitomyces sp. J132]